MRRWERPLATLLIAAAGALLAAHAARSLPFFADDGFISLRYAQRLLAGQGLTWTDGEAVEGYSNLLWVLGCAALAAAGLDLVVAARLLGGLGSLAALLAVVAAARPRSAFAGAAGALVLAGSGSIAVWSFGGLEQPLLAALFAWACVLAFPLLEGAGRGWFAPGALLALACLTRPDGVLLVAGVVGGVVLARPRERASLDLGLKLAGLPALALTGQLAFRLAYYGEWWPNTAYVKLAAGAAHWPVGLLYVLEGLAFLLPLVVLVAALFARAPRGGEARRRMRLLALPVAAWCAYLVAIGGDVFPARRHFVPLVLLLALAVSVGAAEANARAGGARYALRAGTLAALALFAWLQHVDPQNHRAREERWEWDGEVLGRLLGTAFVAERPLLAVDAAGSVPFFSRLPALDMLGLTDRHIARQRPADLGSGGLAHELGDGAYVLSREPDLLLFCLPAGGPEPCFRSGSQVLRDTRFAERYRLIQLEGRVPHVFRSRLWARAEGGRLGIRRAADAVVVPAWFATDAPGSAASLDARGRLVVPVAPGAPAGLAALTLAPGRWLLTPIGVGPPPRVSVSEQGKRAWRTRLGSIGFEVTAGEPRVDVLVNAAGPADRFALEALRFEHLPARSDAAS